MSRYRMLLRSALKKAKRERHRDLSAGACPFALSLLRSDGIYQRDQLEYRVLPHGGEKISVIGLGAGSLSGTKEEMIALLNCAIEEGINYFDMAPACAEAFAGRREQVVTQMHFGAIYKDGKYGWTRDLNEIKQQFSWELELLKTDHTDVGFIHCIDDPEDLDEVMSGGLWDYMKIPQG